ncbi:RNA 2',3'-cyclic phosphodiesterase [Streptomyces fructofermentans]|uniref:RNA 2',3'-cyclic phosphodiesterase n=1 Tax=Streptomyces fructofermentans TaxID=152141 RepID=UPI0034105DC6
MRLFAAVLPPPEAAAELASAAEALRELPGAGDLRWTGRPGWHFTMAFYGEVPDEAVPDLSARLERAARRTGPFPLALRGGGRFGDRALWVGAAGDVHALRLLAGRAEAAGRRAGLPGEDRHRYRPHLTLARGRAAADLAPYVASLDGFTGRTWTVAELSLVLSRLPRSGVPGEQPRYETLARWPLGAAGE